MLRRKTDISIGSASSLALLALTVLFVAVSCGLPFGHQLCHESHESHESHVEPENCPACLLQSSLSLLFGGLVLALVALNASEPNPSAPRTVPLPLFSPRFTHLNRGPPGC
ncbi:MAG: hypothetical protein F4X75_20615 [Gemmatimonadetes bacterium]|nr:hypothetical protein [Gemmatimonadota bacterium]